MFRNNADKHEVAVALVAQAVTMAHRAVMHLSRQQSLSAAIIKHNTLALNKIDNLAITLMGVKADGRAR